MKDFKGITFKWTFRDYQKRVLDNSKKYLDDGKINIVAAPGSGKTILGLELIVRLNNPCLILSPTTTIKYQWGERLVDSFDSKDNLENIISYDLHKINLVNSITYQGLYSAMEKVIKQDDEEDYRELDIFKIIKEKKIKTICLDEAHHLQNEWQRALEKFIKEIDKGIKIISLTATPPYDASSVEWARYKSVCGEIDEEIFVPELIKEGTLCPHQDYIYYNYPSREEMEELSAHYHKLESAISEVFASGVFQKAYDKIRKLFLGEDLEDNKDEYKAILIVCKYLDIKLDLRIIKKVNIAKDLPKYSFYYLNYALNFLLESELLKEVEKEELISILKKYKLVKNDRFDSSLDEKLEKRLISSINKLHSIGEIVKSESNSLKDKLRMLILTDYIKKEDLKDIDSVNDFKSISIISIFETLRRDNCNYKLGVISGQLVILPLSFASKFDKQECIVSKLGETEYGEFKFKATNKEKVAIISELFKKGEIEILIGTKSLLGEGWDCPEINSLILASFVGSFMLSNQMRGRAIRVSKLDKDKISNIFHLVSLDPTYDVDVLGISRDKIKSGDYESLKRRFKCFVGPSYNSDYIENGIERLRPLNCELSPENVSEFNEDTLAMSRDRNQVRDKWNKGLEKGSQLVNLVTFNKNNLIKPIHYLDIKSLIIYSALSLLSILLLFVSFKVSFLDNLFFKLLMGVFLFLFLLFIMSDLVKYINHSNLKKNGKYLVEALLDTLKQMKVINRNASSKIMIINGDSVYARINNASNREQNDYNECLMEFLSKIDNPKYVLVMNEKYKDYTYSYGVPALIGKNQKYVNMLVKYLKQDVGDFISIYTRSESGERELNKCKKKSYINKNSCEVRVVQRVIEDE